MTKQKAGEWATARRLCGDHELNEGCTNQCCPSCRAIVRALRRAEKRGYERGKKAVARIYVKVRPRP